MLETIKFQDANFINEDLSKSIALLLDNDMRVFVYKSNSDKPFINYAFIDNGKGVGYIQGENNGGVRLSTVHKACKKYGTGFGLDGYFERRVDVSIEDLSTMFITIPTWERVFNIEDVVKFPSFEHYLNAGQTGLEYKQLIK